MSALVSIREGIARWVPTWLREDPDDDEPNTGFRILYAFGLLLDAAVQTTLEGVRASLPSLADPSALPYIGRDRRIPRGPYQTPAQYAAALAEWLNLWHRAGGTYTLARALQLYLDPGLPRVRLVNRQSVWSTLESDGSLTHVHPPSPNWDWDSVSNPTYASDPDHEHDGWVIVYAPHFDTDGYWGDGLSFWGQTDAEGNHLAFGHNTSVPNTEQVRQLIHTFKGAHTRVVMVIWSYDDTAFDPAALPGALGMPDGTWGKNYAVLAGGVARRTRRSDCRYWEGS